MYFAEPQLPKRSDSQLKLQRKGSDGASKRHRVNLGGGGGPGIPSPSSGHSQIESGSTSLPRNLPKGLLSSGSGLPAPSSHQESTSKASELESSGSSASSHLAVEGGQANKQAATSIKKVPSLKKPNSTSGLRAPASNKSGLSKPTESHLPSTTSSAKEDEREPSPAASSTTTATSSSKLVAPLKKMPSASSLPLPSTGSPMSKPKLSRLAGPTSASKLSSLKQLHPQVASLSSGTPSSSNTAASGGSTSSLDSCNSDTIKEVGVSPKIDAGTVGTKVESEMGKSRDVAVERESDLAPSRPPPSTLGINKSTSPSKESDIISPPAEFKNLEKTTPPRGTRRISPEGMSQEDSNNGPGETPPKSPGDDSQSTKKQEGNNLSLSESVERNLKNERESAGDSSSLVIPRSQEEGENLPSDDKPKKVTSPLESDTRHLPSGMKIGSETGSILEDQKLKSKGFSQPETGQPAMDSPLLVQKSSTDSKGPASLDEDTSQHRLSREMDTSHGPKPRARSLSPKSSHRVGVAGSGPAYLPAHMIPHTQGSLDFMRTASNDMSSPGGRKPLKSSLRHSNSSAGVGRNLSSNSLEGIKGKVTISPRSSQVRHSIEWFFIAHSALGASPYLRHAVKTYCLVRVLASPHGLSNELVNYT